MHIDRDIKEIAEISFDILKNLEDSCKRINWDQESFGRKEISLVEGRLCMIPCLIARPDQLVKTQDRVQLWEGVSPIVDYVYNLYTDHKMVRGEIVNLKPGKSLSPHIDIHWFHKESKRVHVPIITNDASFLTFEDRNYHLDVGKIYEINNRIMHSGFNNGTSDRVHVIIDMMPITTFNSAVSKKQDFMEKV